MTSAREPSEPPPELPRCSTAPFEVLSELGSGSGGRVHAARLTRPLGDLPAGTPVAVKRASSDPRARRALEREGRVGHDVRHPALVRALAVGEDAEGPWLCMGLVPGDTLRERLERDGPLAEDALRRIGADVAGALAALHRAGWTHGDVKPENARTTEAGGAVLLDLGFARHEDEDPDGRAGSPRYLSPEQTRGQGARPATDVFALGVTLHELATGEHPFPPGGSSDAERQMRAIRRGGDVVPSRIAPRLSPLFDEIVRAALGHDPASRPSAATVAEALTEGEAGAWWRATSARELGLVRARGPIGSLPFVGRAREIGELEACWERARQGEGALVWLSGPVGAGKARLVDAFARRARLRAGPPLCLRERCTPQEKQRTSPVRLMLRQVLQLARHEVPSPRALRWLGELVPQETARALARMLGARDVEGADAPLAEATALARFLVALGRHQPTLVSLEDVDQAGETTLEVLSRVAEELPRTSLLLVLSTSDGHDPEGGATGAEDPGAGDARTRRRTHLRERARTQLDLGPLEPDDVWRLVLLLFGTNSPRRRLATVLHERTGGSPAALTELLEAMRTRGQAHPSAGGRLELTVPPEAIDIPLGLQRSLLERLAELAPAERAWLERCAVLTGFLERPFLLRAFPGADREELDAALAELRERGWLVPFGSRLRFARAPLREAVYAEIPPAERRAMHAHVAQALGELARQRPGASLSFHRVQHLLAGGAPERALDEVLPLIEDARVTAEAARAATLARWGLEALDATPEGRLAGRERWRLRARFLELAADSADRLGARAEERRYLDQLADLPLDPDHDPAAVARVYLLHGQYAASIGQYGLSRRWLENAADSFGRANDADMQALALLRLAYVQGHLGKPGEAERLARRSHALSSDAPARARAAAALATVALVRDEYESALRWIDRALGDLRAVDDAGTALSDLADVYLLQSRTYRVVGRPRRAFAALERARRFASQAGDRRLEVEAGARLGRLLLDVDRADEAELELREARTAAREIEYRRGEALASLFLGTLLAENDRAEGAGVLEGTTGLARELGLGRVEALGKALRARVALQSAELDAADVLSREAQELFDPLGGELADRIVIEATRALVLERTGRWDLAAQRFVELERRVRRVNATIQRPILRQRHRRATSRLLEASRLATGPVYPRMALRSLTSRRWTRHPRSD